MDKEDNTEKHYLPVNVGKSFFIGLLNGFFTLILMFGVYFGIFNTIKTTSYSSISAQKEESYQTVLNLGSNSGLYKTNDTNTSLFSITNYYEYFVGTLLKTDFLSDDYDLTSDPEGFKNKESSFDEFTCITIHDNYVDDDYIGKFFTNFLIGRVDSSGNSLISYTSDNAVSYYLHSILKVDDPESGGQFFNYVDDNNFPHLTALSRSRLFAYVVLKNTTTDLANFDKKFYNYFVEIFNQASDLLMKDKVYLNAYNAFNESNQKLLKFEYFATLISFGTSVILLSFVLPLFIKDRRNIGQLINGVYVVNEAEKYPVGYLALNTLFDFIKYFFLTYVLSFFGESQVMSNYLFYIGNFGIGLAFFAALSLIYIVLSIIFGLFNSDSRTLSAFLSRTYICKRARNYERNIHSDIVSE